MCLRNSAHDEWRVPFPRSRERPALTMDISTLANSINAIAVTAGVIFAAAQISYYRRRRRRDAMLELVRSFQSPTFSKAFRYVVELPDNASAEVIRKFLGLEGEDLLVYFTVIWE